LSVTKRVRAATGYVEQPARPGARVPFSRTTPEPPLHIAEVAPDAVKGDAAVSLCGVAVVVHDHDWTAFGICWRCRTIATADD
jgi:hypothetical protein